MVQPQRVYGVVKFGDWRPPEPELWPVILGGLMRWTVEGKALLYDDKHVPVDLGTLSQGSSTCVIDGTLEVYDAQLWRVWSQVKR